jgi:hypothetical protein
MPLRLPSLSALFLGLLWCAISPGSPTPPSVEEDAKDPLTGWYWNVDPETGEAVGMVSVTTAGTGYFVCWDYTPTVEGKEISRKQIVGQGKRRANVLSVVWGKGELSTYEIKGRQIVGDGELWLPVPLPKFVHAPLSFVAAPVRPLPKSEKDAPELLPAPIVMLPSYCMWGAITQQGRHFTLDGDTWTATGTVMPDSRVQVQWLSRDGVLAQGVYEMDKAGAFNGLWGYSGDCEILGNGNIVGTHLMSDRLAPMAPPKAEGPDL